MLNPKFIDLKKSSYKKLMHNVKYKYPNIMRVIP
jgi:hypothetical protein